MQAIFHYVVDNGQLNPKDLGRDYLRYNIKICNTSSYEGDLSDLQSGKNSLGRWSII